jgi:hypothetical protein
MMERDCQYNKAIICDSAECYHCGWDPNVTKERMKAMLGEKKYKIPVTGHFEVWANSPEEALEKADNDDVFFAHYDFGDPECLEKENEDELD